MKNGKDKLIEVQLMRELEDKELDQVTGGTDTDGISKISTEQIEKLINAALQSEKSKPEEWRLQKDMQRNQNKANLEEIIAMGTQSVD